MPGENFLAGLPGTCSLKGPRIMAVTAKSRDSERGADTATGKRKRARLTRTERADRNFSVLMIAPAFIAVIAIMGYPWFYSLWLSLHSINLLTKRWTWVGFGNYQAVLPDPTFTDSLIRTLWFSGLVVIGGTLLGLLMALVLNEAFRGRGIMRSVMLMPWAIAPIVVGKVFLLIYSGEYGVLNGVLYQFHIIDTYIPWMTEARRALILVAIASIWQSAPLSGLLLLAGLQSLPGNLLSAARIDGASSWQRFRKIVLPWIRPMLLLVMILNTINALLTFDLIYALTQGGPGEATTVVSWLGYITFFNFARYGQGTAILYVLSLISLVLAILYFLILNRKGKMASSDQAPVPPMSGVRDLPPLAIRTTRVEFRQPRIPPRVSRRFGRISLYAAVVLIGVWSLGPFYVMLNASLSSTQGILSKPPSWFPNPITLDNYRVAIFGEQVKDASGPSVQGKAIIISMKNSAIVSLSVTLVNLIVGAPAGYAFARFGRFKITGIALWVLMLTRMIPALTLAVPFFMLFRRVGLIDTKLGLVIALSSVILPLTVWILKGYFETLPPNLERAALVDGCTRFQSFRRIVIPIAIPGMVAAGIFCFLVAWNEFVYAILLTSTLDSQTLPTRISQFVSDQRVYNPGLLFAAGALAVLPPVLITLGFQRFLLRER
jgi:multiple sugar transport system permease protein